MARDLSPRGKHVKDAGHLSEFRKDALEVFSEVLGGKLGKTLAEVLPVAIKDALVAQLGGPDGAITEQQIDVFSYLPKFLFRGTMSEEDAQSFVRHFGQALRDYSANPHPDKAQRRNDLKRIFTGALTAANDNATATVKKTNFFEALAMLPDADRALALKLILALRQQNATTLPNRANPGQTVTVTYGELEKLGNEREVATSALKLSVDILKMGDKPAALEEWLRVLKTAPLLNPPKVPTPSLVDGLKKDFDKVRAEFANMGHPIIIHRVMQGEVLEAIARQYQITPSTIRLLNDMTSDDLTVNADIRVVQGPLHNVFSAMERKSDKWRKSLGHR